MEVEKIETMVEVEADGWAVAMECRVERYLELGQNCGERDKIETDMDHLRVANRDGHRRSWEMVLRITPLSCMHDARIWRRRCRRVPH